MKQIIYFFTLLTILAACNGGNQKMTDESALYEAPLEDIYIPKDEIGINNNIPNDKKIIKTGRIDLKVEDLEKTKNHIDILVKENNAYYANENLQNSDYSNTYSLKIRIPAANFDRFVNGIESGEAELTYKSIEANDVTEEYIDIETRLATKRNYLNRYNELVKKANSIKDILEIEEKIRVIEEEIEGSQGKLNYLSNQASFGTLDISIFKEKKFEFKESKRINFFERLKKSISGGWHGLISFIIFILNLWPLILVIIILIPLWRRYKRSKKGKD